MLIKFGSSAICMNSTHGTNCYDFNRTSLVVVDEYGEGIPVGWMISNRQDTLVTIEFLKSIRDRTGSINPKWFMTDDAEQFFTAWRGWYYNKVALFMACRQSMEESSSRTYCR